MPNEIDAAIATFKPRTLKDSRLKTSATDTSKLIQEGYEEERRRIAAEEKAALKSQVAALSQEQAIQKEERKLAEQRQEDLIKAENDTLVPQWRAEGRPTYRESLTGRVRPVHDDATWADMQEQKKLEEEQKAQAKADAAFRKAESVRLNKESNAIEDDVARFKTAGHIASQAVQAKAAEITALNNHIKNLEDTAASEADLARLDSLRSRRDNAIEEKAALENNERTIGIARTNREIELAPEQRKIEQQRAGLPIMTAPRLDAVKSAAIDVPNPSPEPASADPTRTAAVLRDHITLLREKGDFKRADALERRLTDPEGWNAEQAAFRAGATAEQLQQTIESQATEITARAASLRQNYDALKASQQQYVTLLDKARSDNEQLLAGTYSDGDVVEVQTVDGQTERWHKGALGTYQQAAEGLRRWEAENRGKIDLLDVDRQQLQIDASNLDKHQKALAYKGREQQRNLDAERATALSKLRSEPGLAPFADEIEAEVTSIRQRTADISRKYTDPALRSSAMKALDEELRATRTDRQQRMQAVQDSAKDLYESFGKNLNITDWANDASVGKGGSIDLAGEARRRGFTEEEGRRILDMARKSDWTRPMVGEAAKGNDYGPDIATGIGNALAYLTGNDTVAEPSRNLPDGSLSINPALWLDEKAYLKAASEAATGKDAKDQARKVFPKLQEMAAAAMVSQLETELKLPGLPDFNSWRTEFLQANQENARKPLAQQALAYLKDMKARHPGSQAVDSLARNLTKGLLDLGSTLYGAALLATGSESVGRFAQDSTALAQSAIAAGDQKTSIDGTLLRTGNLTAQLLPQLAPIMIGGGLLAATGRISPMLAASILSGTQTAGLQEGSSYTALRAKGLTHKQAYDRTWAPALTSGIMTGLLTFLGGKTGGEAALAGLMNKAGREAAREALRKSVSSVGGLLKTIGANAAGEIAEEVPDELFSQISEAIATEGPRANLAPVIDSFVRSLPELALSVGAIGGGTALATEALNRSSMREALLAEDVAAAEGEIDLYRDDRYDEATNDQIRNRASLALAIARGVDLNTIDESILNAAGWTRRDTSGVTRADGSLTKLKDYTGPNMLDVDSNGRVKLDSKYAEKLKEHMPVLAGLVSKKHTDWHTPGKIEDTEQASTNISPASPATGPTAASSGEVSAAKPVPGTRGTSGQGPVKAAESARRTEQTPVTAPAPKAGGAASPAAPPAAPIDPATQQKERIRTQMPWVTDPTDPRPQRAWEVANHLEMAGLQRDQAEAVAIEHVKKNGIIGKSVNEQVTSDQFTSTLDAFGATGDRTTRAGTEPLKITRAPADRQSAKEPETDPQTKSTGKPSATPKGGRPEYQALRQKLAAREMSTIEAVRAVVRLSGEHDTGVIQDILTDHLGLKKPAAAAAVETLRAAGELTGDADNIPIAAGKRAPGPQYTATKDFAPASTRDLPRNTSQARARIAALASLPPRARRWGWRYINALEGLLAQNSPIFEAFMIGPNARRLLSGQQIAVMNVDGRVTLLVDLHALMRNVSDLGDPRRRAAATISEETWHAAQLHLERSKPEKWNKKALASQWNALPTELKQKVWSAYHNAGSRPLPDKFTPAEAYALQSEFLRMLGQGSIDPASITETIDPAGGLMQQIRDLLADLYATLRKLIKGLPASQAQTLDQQVAELRAVRDSLLQQGPPSEDALARMVFLRDPVATFQQALRNGTLWQSLARQEPLFTEAGLARVWQLLTPEFRLAAERDPSIASAATPQEKARLLTERLMDRSHARTLAQTVLQPTGGAKATTSTVRRMLNSLMSWLQGNRQTLAGAIAGLDKYTAEVLSSMQAHIAAARAEFEAAAGVQSVTSAAIQQSIAEAGATGVNAADDSERRSMLIRTAEESAAAMQAAWAQDEQKRAFFDAAHALAEQMLPGVSDAIQRSAIARQMAGRTWEGLKARMELNLARLNTGGSQPSQVTPPLALPSPAQRSAQAIQELTEDRDNLAQQNTSPAAREAIARRLLQEAWASAVLRTAANAERRYYSNAGELSPEEAREIDSLMLVASGELELGWQADRRQIGTAADSGTPIRQMGFGREEDLRAIGIHIEPDGTAWADRTAPVYIERGRIIIKQLTLDDLSERLPITRQMIRMSEAQARAQFGLTGTPAPVTNDSIAAQNADRAAAITARRQAARLNELEQAERDAQEGAEPDEETGALLDPGADPETGKLQPGERGDIISWLSAEGSLGWPDANMGGEWDWLKPYLAEYFNVSLNRTRTKILKDKAGNVIGKQEVAAQATKLGISNSSRSMARRGDLSTPGAVVEWLIQNGVLTPAVTTPDNAARDLSPHPNVTGGAWNIDAVEEAAKEANYAMQNGIGHAVLDAIEARKAARRARLSNPEAAGELQALRFERDTRAGPFAVEAHQLATLADEGPTYVTVRSPDADLTQVEVVDSEWQPIDTETREIEDYLDGHPAFRGISTGRPERLVVTLSGGTLYGRQTVPGEAILRVHDTGNTGIGVDLSEYPVDAESFAPADETPEQDAMPAEDPEEPSFDDAIAQYIKDLTDIHGLAANHRWTAQQVEVAREEMYSNQLDDEYTGGNAWFDPRFQKWINLGNDSHYLASGIVHEFGYGPVMAAGFVRVTTETYGNGKSEIYAEFFGPPTRRLRKVMEDTAMLQGMDPSYDVHLEANAERFYGNPDDANPPLAAAERFYSRLAQVVSAKMPNRATPDLVRNLISNPQTGIKQEELKWSGILSWLDKQNGQISKDTVLNYLRTEGAVQFIETRLGNLNDKFTYRPTQRPERNGQGFDVISPAGEFIIWEATEASAQEAIANMNDGYNRGGGGMQSNTRNSNWTLPGGTNQQEVVVTWKQPGSINPDSPISVEMTDDGDYIATSADGTFTQRITGPMTAERAQIVAEHLRAQRLEKRVRQNTTPNTYSDRTHYGDLDALAWFRANDRTDADGQPGLFVEEFQSKWHQEGREKGYKGDPHYTIKPDDATPGMWSVRNRSGDVVSFAVSKDEAQRLADIQNKELGIPDAPYRKDWPLMLFKRALADAVASGKAWIGWTSGDTQADRYDLSKQVSTIQWNADTGKLEAYSGGTVVLNKSGVTAEQLGEFVGKEPAKKLIEGKRNRTGYSEVSGEDLKVGGDGMRKFYDDMLVKEFGKYVKQWGGKVGKAEIHTRLPSPADPGIDENGNSTLTTPIWRIDITPAMRESVSAGQPLFASRRVDSRTLETTTNLVNSALERKINQFDKFAAELHAKLPQHIWNISRPYLFGAWDIVSTLNNLPRINRDEAERVIERLESSTTRPFRKSPAPEGISQQPTPKSPAPGGISEDMLWEMGLDDNPTPDPYEVPPGRRVVPREPTQEDNQAQAEAAMVAQAEEKAPPSAPSIFAVPPPPEAPPMPETPEERIEDGWNPYPEDEHLPKAPLISKGDLDAAKPVNIQGGKSSLLSRGIYNRVIAALARHSSAIGDMFFGTGTVTQYIHKAGLGKPNGHASEYSPWRASFLRQVTDPAKVEPLVRGARDGIEELKRVQQEARDAVHGATNFATAYKGFAAFLNRLDHSAISDQAWTAIHRRALSGYQTSIKDKDWDQEQFTKKARHFARVHGLKARVMIGMYQALPEGFDLAAYAQKVAAAQAWDKHLLESQSGQTSMFVPPKAEHPGPIPARDDPATTGLYIAAEMLSDNGISLDLDAAGSLNEPFTGLFDDDKWWQSERAQNIERLIRDYHQVFVGKTIHSANSWMLLPRLARKNSGIGFVIDPPYFGVPEMKNGRVIMDENGQPVRKGTSNYDSTTDIRTPDDLLRLFDSYVLPAWESGARFVLTNEWDDSAAVALRLRGATVIKIARQGRTGDTPELVAYNFNPSSGELRPRRISRISPGQAFSALRRGAYPGANYSGDLDPRVRMAAGTATEAESKAFGMALQQRPDAAKLPRGSAAGRSGGPVGTDQRPAPRAPTVERTMAPLPPGAAATPLEAAQWDADAQEQRALADAADTIEDELGDAADMILDDPRLSASLRQAFPGVPAPTDTEVRQILASAPRRARQSMEFDPPFKAPFGDILRYDWTSRPVGDMQSQRISDWNNATTNGQTGRQIVHLFKVRKPDGIHTVSLETAMGMLSADQRTSLNRLIRAHHQRQQDEAAGQLKLFAAPRTSPSQSLVIYRRLTAERNRLAQEGRNLTPDQAQRLEQAERQLGQVMMDFLPPVTTTDLRLESEPTRTRGLDRSAAADQMRLFASARITEPPFATPEQKALEDSRIHAIDTLLHGQRRPIAQASSADVARSSRAQLQALLSHLRRGQRTGGLPAGDEQTRQAESRRREKTLLIDWARNAGVLLGAIPARYQINSTANKGGSEHHVFHDTASGRWVKITKGDGSSFGYQPLDEGKNDEWMISKDPADLLSYLEKLTLHNQVFHDDIVLHGVVADPLGKVALIISQPDYQGTFADAVVSIQPAMEAAGFVRIEPPSARFEDPSAYYRPADNIAVIDLHDQNAVLEDNGTFLRVFDNIMLQPSGALRATFERLAAKNAKPGLASAPRTPAQTIEATGLPASERNARLTAWQNVPGKGDPESLQTGYISGKHNDTIARRAAKRGDIGLLVTPLIPSYLAHAAKYPFMAVDNGVFSKATPFNPENFRALVERVAETQEVKSKVLFVVAPDVVGDAARTLDQFGEWADYIHSRGLPAALAAQDGLEDIRVRIPWDQVDVLFIGGSTEWKTGQLPPAKRAAWAEIFMEAHRRGIPIHMGRVNTNDRIAGIAQIVGASTVDGTYLAFGPDKNLPKLESMLDELNVHGRDLGAQRFPELGRYPSDSELYDLALDEEVTTTDALGAYEPAAKEINAIRVSNGLPSLQGHRNNVQMELALWASSRLATNPALPASERLAQAAQKTNTAPTEAQKEAENYQTGKVTVQGLRLSIENPRGSVRRGIDANGKPWEITMAHHYGRILGTKGADKDHVDFFMGPHPESPVAYVINQRRPGNGHFDEHKVMLGFTHHGAAVRGYLDSYSKGWKGYQSVVPMTIDQLKHWLEHGKMDRPVTLADPASIDTKLASGERQADPIFASTRQVLDATSRASFNHLDRKLTRAIGRMADGITATEPVAAAIQAARDWHNGQHWSAQGVRAVKDFLQQQFLPETVLPREVLSAMRTMNIKTAMGQQQALDLNRALSGSPKFSDLAYPPEFIENPAHREAMFDAMEQGTTDRLPEPLRKLAEHLRSLLVEHGREAVRQGRMSPDTFEGLRTTYMPRFTRDEAQASAGDWSKRFKLGIKDILAQRSTAWHIVDTSRKDKTGQPVIVSHSKGKWRFANAQARDAHYEELIQRETLNPDLSASQDWHWMTRRDARLLRSLTPEALKAPATLTKEQREIVGRVQRQLRQQFRKEDPYQPKDLVKDPVYAVMRYLAQMAHDNATAEFFNLIDANPAWTTPTESKGFTQIPDSDRFGALAGKWVRADIADQVLEFADVPNQFWQLYDGLLRLWKTGKTVLNPATHARNILGNIPFAQMAGNNPLNPANWMHYAAAARVLREGGTEYRQLYESGVLGADYASTELKAALHAIVPVEAAEDGSNPIRTLISIGNRAAQWAKAHSAANLGLATGIGATLGGLAAGPIGAMAGAGLGAGAGAIYRGALWAYRMEDDLFKAATYLKARDMGMTIEQAADHVRAWFPYYDKPTSEAIKLAGRTALPFVSFFRESGRIFTKALKERPLALATTLAIPTLVTLVSEAMLGLTDKDDDDVKKGMRGKAAKLLGPTPLAGMPLFSMLTPWRTADGQLQQIDLSSTHPFADFLADRVENWNNDPWWQTAARAALSNPILGLIYTASTGRDPFGDRVLWDSTYTPEEKGEAVFGHLWKTVVPPLAPGGTNWTMIEQSGRRMSNKTMALRSPTQAVARGVAGIDVRSADPNIYDLADQFRRDRGLPVQEGNVAFPTDPAGRARKALFDELVQPSPNPDIVAKHLQTLNDLGKPVRTSADVLDIIERRRPDAVINPKALRGPFRASLAPEARRVLDRALEAYRTARAAAPGSLAAARMKVKATTRRATADAP